MSQEHQFGVISTIAAMLVLIFSVTASRRGEDSIAQGHELAALPFGVIFLLVIAFVTFFWVVPLAELFGRPAMWGLGMSVLSLLLLLTMFWIRSRLSIDWGFLGGVSILVGAGGVLVGEVGRKRSAGPGLSHLAIVIGLLTVIVNFVVFALDVLGLLTVIVTSLSSWMSSLFGFLQLYENG
jgi:hypothetical protein